ncbi:MAG: hypothetical protein DHS20C17_18490 [Cyclobacteriaceae bacterium]|nr:MAG: hypothetical protein DHS20C17_18490 [Cyclobacteriaceae bacterium]
MTVSCGDDEPVNQPPGSFSQFSPGDGAIEVSLAPSFSWQAVSDPDGGTVVYDLLLGTSSNPSTSLSTEDNKYLYGVIKSHHWWQFNFTYLTLLTTITF